MPTLSGTRLQQRPARQNKQPIQHSLPERRQERNRSIRPGNPLFPGRMLYFKGFPKHSEQYKRIELTQTKPATPYTLNGRRHAPPVHSHADWYQSNARHPCKTPANANRSSSLHRQYLTGNCHRRCADSLPHLVAHRLQEGKWRLHSDP